MSYDCSVLGKIDSVVFSLTNLNPDQSCPNVSLLIYLIN